VVAIALALVDDLVVCSAAAMLLFLVFSKQVIEQYLIWPMPLLALLWADARSRTALVLVCTLTIAGMLVNAHFHPFGVQPAPINVVLAVLVSAGTGRLLWRQSRQEGTAT
jgi:hypothetical protein